ncbi:DUF3299 domain-containing protein [Roseateles chitinivorans]|uniref:DUF3299 domain-containing protein n=1 Tax=Roseateles chitinivorans TaxID=2917965 RepID=UPI003D67CF4D
MPWTSAALLVVVAIGVPAGLLLNRTDPSQAIASAPLATEPPADVKTIAWTELMPPGWDPRLKAGQAGQPGGIDIAQLDDNDPVARQMLKDLRDAFDNAPVRPELDGRRVRLRGYAVPVGVGWGGTDEFLLVPSFGACIHSPPPPPNQIVYVKTPSKIEGVRAMSIVTVTGTLQVHALNSALATSGYRLVPGTVRVER